jgi:hypothetical protein
MQVHVDDVWQLDGEHLPNADRGGAPARALDVIELEHDHVAAITAEAVQVAAGGRAGRDRRDDLDERVAERHHRVPEAECRDGGIAERLAQLEPGAQRRGDRLQIAGDEDDLTEAHHARA